MLRNEDLAGTVKGMENKIVMSKYAIERGSSHLV